MLELAELAVAEREAIRRDDIARGASACRACPSACASSTCRRIDISSSLIRRRVAEGPAVRYLVPDAVERAIAERGLYRAEVTA